MKKLSAAVIGLGFIGPQHIDAIRRIPCAEVITLCDMNRDAAEAACRQFQVQKCCTDWRDVVADPQISVIHNCTPNELHDEINRAAILAGKHVYCEKPLSGSAAGARDMYRLAKEHGIAAGINHQYRLNAAVQEMRARLQKGMSGKPLMVFGRYLQESASQRTSWNHKMENTGIARCISDIGIHWLDTACCVLGQPVTQVMATLINHFPVRETADGVKHVMTTEDTGMIMMRFADGTPGCLVTSKAANGHKNDFRLSFSCEEYGMEWLQEEPDRLYIGQKELGEQRLYMNPRTCQPEVLPYVTTPMGHVMGWPDALRNAVAAFYASIQKGSYREASQPYATFADGFRGMAFVEACIQSSKAGQWTEVEPL